MKRWLIFAAALLAVSASVYAAKQWAIPGFSEPREIEGVVESIDMAATPPLLSLRTDQGIELVSLDPQETTVLLGGKPAPFSELVAGQQVKAIYRVRSGKEVATSIVVKTPPISFPPPPASGPVE